MHARDVVRRAGLPRGEPEPRSARELAALAIETALTQRGYAADLLQRARRRNWLSDPERALATEIALGALRHRHTIEHLLAQVGQFEPRRVPLPLLSVLYAGAQQAVWMSGVPLHAAVNESVALAKLRCGRHASGMVNALLRRLTDGIAERAVPWLEQSPFHVRTGWSAACALRDAAFPDPARDATGYIAAAAGETRARVEALLARFGPQSEAIAWASQAVPTLWVQRNPLRADAASFREAALHGAPQHAVHVDDERAAFAPQAGAGAWALVSAGFGIVQDDSAHAAARLLDARAGEQIVDLCAAPGGKAMALAMAMENRGRVIACDVSAARLEQIAENATRLGLTAVQVLQTPADLRAPLSEAARALLTPGRFDAVLADVPCSNSGVIARRPEARWRLDGARLTSLRDLQLQLLLRAADLVRPGGRLVYSTCSIEPEENEGVVAAFLEQRGGQWQLAQQSQHLPSWGPRPDTWSDGAFAALLHRV